MIQTSSRDRRTTTRRTVDLEAVEATTRARLRAIDLSLGGALITDVAGGAHAEGDSIALELSLPHEPAPLRVRAFVVAAGAGWRRVCFLDLRRGELVKLAEHLWS